MKVAKGLDVRLEYELRIKGGEVIETSAHRGPLTYRHGEGKMLAGLEKRLEGLGPGAEKKGVIPAGEAFGDESSLPTTELPRSSFPKDAQLAAGHLFAAKAPDGAPIAMKILSINEQTVTVRLLHPLAGKDLEFRVKVLGVTAPGTAPPPPPDAVPEVDLDEIRER